MRAFQSESMSTHVRQRDFDCDVCLRADLERQRIVARLIFGALDKFEFECGVDIFFKLPVLARET